MLVELCPWTCPRSAAYTAVSERCIGLPPSLPPSLVLSRGCRSPSGRADSAVPRPTGVGGTEIGRGEMGGGAEAEDDECSRRDQRAGEARVV